MMELSGTYRFTASPADLWNLLNDPDVLATCLPGCERLEPLGDDRFRAELTMSVAAISGRYTATIAITEKAPPHSYRLKVEGSGKAGFLKGEAVVRLTEDGGETRVNVNGTGEVGGLIARVGQRLLGSVSKMMMDRFFEALKRKATTQQSD
jgi:carbon monoxide dehydrogenase subunit G